MKEDITIWKMDQKLRKCKHKPFEEHILTGYKIISPKIKKLKIENLKNQVTETKYQLPSGGEAIFLIPKHQNNEIIVSLHGGPESYEGCEIRYLGLYRNLLRRGFTIAILNYRGSNKLSCDRTKTWKNWKKSILTDFNETLEEASQLIKIKSINLIGASFGGALALMLTQNFVVDKCVLFSPLLDLEHQRLRAGADFKKWFDLRFSKVDFNDLSFYELIKNKSCRTLAICSQKDEVLGSKLSAKLKKENHITVLMQNTTHNPKTLSACLKRFNSAFNWFSLQE